MKEMLLIGRQSLTSLLQLFFILTLSLSAVSVAGAQEKEADMTKVSDTQLLEKLASRDEKNVDSAIDETLRRGEKMISLLIGLKGQRQTFGGRLSRRENASTLVFEPKSKNNKTLLKEGKLVTLEVAALYLINAIYFETLDISQSPYLTDLSVPKEKRQAANTPAVIEKAWKSVEEWYRKEKIKGLENVRKNQESPFQNGEVRFW
jgi:hypothetical protein